MTLQRSKRFTRFLLPAALLCAGVPAGFACGQAGDATLAGTDQVNASLPATAAASAAFSGVAAPAFAADGTAAASDPTLSSEAISSEAVSVSETLSSSSAADTLPDAPSTVMLAAYATDSAYGPQNSGNRNSGGASGPVASRYTKYIPAGWTAQPITAHDKVILGLRDLYSPLTLLGDVASAGYSELVDGQPNYGVDRTALGQRVGATFLRDSTEGLFTDTVFAPLLREDPRYFVEGPQYNFFHRLVYAATRPVLTRTDSGHSSINGAELFGYAGASALSYTYYPQINRNFKDTAATFGGGLGGSAIGFVVSEFADQVLQAVHLEKRD